MEKPKNKNFANTASRISAIASSVMDLHVRIALQEVDREKRRLIQSVEDVKSHLNNLAKEFGKKKSAGESLNVANYKDEILTKIFYLMLDALNYGI